MSSESPLASQQTSAPPKRRYLGRVSRLALKELRETLRDRRTITTLVMMPLLVYPILGLVFQRYLITTLPTAAKLEYRIGLASEEDEASFAPLLLLARDLQKKESAAQTETRKESQEKETPPDMGDLAAELNLPDPATIAEPELKSQIIPEPELALKQGTVDVAIKITNRENMTDATPLKTGIDCEILYLADSAIGAEAANYIEQQFKYLNGISVEGQLRHFIPEKRIFPTNVTRTTIGEIQESGMASLATVIPLVFILMTITGAVYPAIDLTAGERERGTLEMLIAAPIPRLGILLAKYAAVVLVAVLTASVNLIAMSLTIASVGLGSTLFGDEGLSLSTIIMVFGLMVLFSAFFSAILLAVTSFARSFKEAQAYLIPLMLMSIGPGIISMMPGIELNNTIAVIPLVNIVILSRDLFANNAPFLLSMVVVVSTLFYALVAIALASRIFGTDAILYGSEGSWSDLFQRPAEKQSAPSFSSALFCLATMFPLFFFVVHFLTYFQNVSMTTQLVIQSGVAALLFAGIPTIAAFWGNCSFQKCFSLNRPPLLSLVAGLILGLSLWPFAYELILLVERYFGGLIDETVLDRAEGIVAKIKSAPTLGVLIAFAIVPAVVEEFFFRGFLLSSLLTKTTRFKAIVVSGVLFGLFHVVVKDSLAIERLLPSTFLGLVLGWVCCKSNSLFPGIILHACNNGFLLMVARHQEQLEKWGIGLQKQKELPLSWLATAVIVSGIGFILLKYVHPISKPDASQKKLQIPHD